MFRAMTDYASVAGMIFTPLVRDEVMVAVKDHLLLRKSYC